MGGGSGDKSGRGSNRWVGVYSGVAAVLTAEETVELGFRFSIFRPEEADFRLSLPLQTIEDREGDADD